VQLAGISVDPPAKNLRMVNKLVLPFPLLSDPEGELAKLLGLWNEEESVAVPAIVVVDKSGTVRHVYAGEDFADRPPDEELFEALDRLEDGEPTPDEPAVRVVGENTESVGPDKPAQTLEKLVPYYRGVAFTTIALKRRFDEQGNKKAFREVDEYQKMIRHYQEALNETIKLHEEA
jgi:hypothetical protein